MHPSSVYLDDITRKKAEAVRFFAAAAALIIGMAAVIRLTQHNYLQAGLDALLVFFFIATNRVLKVDPSRYVFFSRLGLFAGFVNIVLLKAFSNDVFGTLFWTFSFIITAFALRDRKEGWFWFALIVGAHLVIYVFYTRSLFAYPADFYLFLGNLFMVAFAISWYESIKEKSLETTNSINAMLEERVQQRTYELQKAMQKAEEASRAKSTFLATMSHEIRTPLNAINGFISLLRENEKDPQKQQYLDIIDNSSKNLLRIISDILDFSKIENEQIELSMSDFSPCDLIEDIARLHAPKAAEKNIELYTVCDLSLPEHCHCDPFHIRQILENFLSNAIKFTPDRGEIHFKSYYENGHICFEVRDSGIGMDKATQRQVFDAFVQADSSTVREYGGTGLGLAISKKLAEMLKGEIQLKSRPGEGSTFTLCLPAEIREAPARETGESPELLPQHLPAHLLIVEDNRANQMFLGLTLKKAGMTYDNADNGLEAVEQVEKKEFDLILMDENMPKMGGIEATAKIRELETSLRRSQTPIIAVTANAVKGDKERFLAAGMDDYISKPFEPEELIERIQNILFRKRSQHD